MSCEILGSLFTSWETQFPHLPQGDRNTYFIRMLQLDEIIQTEHEAQCLELSQCPALSSSYIYLKVLRVKAQLVSKAWKTKPLKRLGTSFQLYQKGTSRRALGLWLQIWRRGGEGRRQGWHLQTIHLLPWPVACKDSAIRWPHEQRPSPQPGSLSLPGAHTFTSHTNNHKLCGQVS